MKSKKIDLTFPDDLLVGRTPDVFAVVAPPTASITSPQVATCDDGMEDGW